MKITKPWSACFITFMGFLLYVCSDLRLRFVLLNASSISASVVLMWELMDKTGTMLLQSFINAPTGTRAQRQSTEGKISAFPPNFSLSDNNCLINRITLCHHMIAWIMDNSTHQIVRWFSLSGYTVFASLPLRLWEEGISRAAYTSFRPPRWIIPGVAAEQPAGCTWTHFGAVAGGRRWPSARSEATEGLWTEEPCLAIKHTTTYFTTKLLWLSSKVCRSGRTG